MKTLLVIVFFMAGGYAFAQTLADSTSPATQTAPYRVSVQAAGGYAADLSDYTEQAGLTLNRNQFFTYAQIRWLPGNLLTGSLEVGYLNLYSVTSDGGGKSVRSAVPVNLLFSMEPLSGLELTAGFGLAFLSSNVSGAAGTATSSAVSMATMGAVSYLIPVGTDLKVGAEARFSYMDLYDDKVLGIGAVIRYSLLSY